MNEECLALLDSIIMIMGYGLIAVPTGIFSLELRQASKLRDARACPRCATPESDAAASFCRRCGEALKT